MLLPEGALNGKVAFLKLKEIAPASKERVVKCRQYCNYQTSMIQRYDVI